MTRSEPGSAAPERFDVRREALTMALYVAICLLAALIAVPADQEHAHALGVIWGISVGLVLAHLFAFRVATRVVRRGRAQREDLDLAGAQLGGGALVAVLASVPILVLPSSAELLATELVLAALICACGYVVARRSGAARVAAGGYAVVLVAAAVGLAVVKNELAGH